MRILSIIFTILLTFSVASAEYFSDIIITGTDSLWIDSRAYLTLDDAITAIGTDERELVIAEEEAVTTLTIPDNVKLRFLGEGSINNSGLLTIETKDITAPDRQIFTGSGHIDFADGAVLRTSWFENLVTAITMTDGTYDRVSLIVSEKGYINADCSVGDLVQLKWESPRNVIVVDSGFELSNVGSIDAGDYQIFAGTGDIDFVEGIRLNLSWFKRLRSAITWVESERVSLAISGNSTVSYSDTVQSNITLDFESGSGQFSIDSGVTLVIKGPIICGLHQAFSGSGTISLADNNSLDYVRPEWWGATADGSTDSTTAIEACIAAVHTMTDYRQAVIKFAAGDYMCHEVDLLTCHSSLIGVEVGNTRLVYNGSGGAGSYLLGYNATTGSLPYSGIYNMSLIGYDGSTGEIAETLWDNIGTAGLDWGAKFENVQFAQCYGDAIDTHNGLVVNLHLNRVRWDSVGGFCMYLKASALSEARPVTINQFTADNNIYGNFATKAQSDGYYNGTNWCKGLLRIDDGAGLFVRLNHGRFESNKSMILHNTRKCLVYSDNTLSGTLCYIHFEQFVGFGHVSDGLVGVYAPNNRTELSFQDNYLYHISSLFENALGDVISGFHPKTGATRQNDQQGLGLTMQSNQVEYRPAAPTGGNYNWYRKGDVVFTESPTVGDYVGWICTAPTTGFGRPQSGALTAAAIVVAGNASITVPAANFYNFFVNQAITLVGAGAGGVNLDTYVTNTNPTSSTVTVNDVPSTSVNPATVNVQTTTFTEFGNIQLHGSVVWNPASIASGNEMAANVTVTGAVLGDYAIASFSLDVQDLVLDAQVTAADTVTCVLANNTGGPIDLAAGTLRVRVIKY